MKPRRSTLSPCFPTSRAAFIKIAYATVCLSGSALAVDFTLEASDSSGSSSFTNPLTGGGAAGWTDGVASDTAPTAGNDYFTNAFLLRTPTTGSQILAFGGDSLTIGGNGVSAAGRFIIKSNGSTYNANYKLDGGLIDQSNGGGNSGTIGGTIELLAGGGNLGAGASNEILNVTAPISGSGNLSINLDGTYGGGGATLNGIVILSGANDYSGTTTISTGRLHFPTPNSMSASSAITVTSGGALAVNVGGPGEFTTGTGNGTIGGLFAGLGGQSGSTIAYAAGNAIGLDTTNAVSTVTLSEDFDDADAGVTSIGLTKLGSGTLALSGTNTYSGKTTINGGTLELQNAASASPNSGLSGAGGGTLNLNAGSTESYLFDKLDTSTTGATLNIVSTTGDTLEFDSGSTINGTGGGAWALNSFNVDLNGADMLLNGLSQTNVNGGITVSSSTGNSLTIEGNVFTSTARTLFARVNSGALNLNNTVSTGGGTNQGFFALLDGGTLNVNNADAIQNNRAITGSSAGLVIVGGTLNNTSGAAISLINNPTVLLNGDFAFSTGGGTSNNSLNLGSGAASFGPAAGTARTITTNGSATLRVGGALAGGTTATGLIKAGTGTLALGGANTYTGATDVNVGTLALVGGSQASPITVAADASLDFTLASLVTSTSSVDLTNGDVTITGAVDNSSDYHLMTAAGGFTFTNSLTQLGTAIPGYELELQNSGTELWLVFTGGGGTTYASWSGGVAADIDSNGDSVQNAVAYTLGAANVSENAIGLLPTLGGDATYIIFNYNRSDDANDDGTTAISVEYGSDLSGWTTAMDAVNGVIITETPGSPTDAVEVKIPRALEGDGKLFARLKVAVTP